jgi:hypothetical protein
MTVELTPQEIVFIRNLIGQIQVQPLDPNAMSIVTIVQELGRKLSEQPAPVSQS